MDDMNNMLNGQPDDPKPENNEGRSPDLTENSNNIPSEAKNDPYEEKSFGVPPQMPYGGYQQTPPPTPQMYNIPSNLGHGNIPTNNFGGNVPPSGQNPQMPNANMNPNYPQQPYMPNRNVPPMNGSAPNGNPPQMGQNPYMPNGAPYQQRNVPPQQAPYNQQNMYGRPPMNNPYPQYGGVPPYANVNEGKKGNVGVVIGVIAAVVALLIVAGVLMSLSVKDSGTDTVTADNKVTDTAKDSGSDNIVVNIETKDKPKLEDSYYQADGVRLTTEGVAKMVSPSVCEIICYGEGNISPTSKGSGIIISEDGYILTNAHVIDGAKGIKTVLEDETEYVAEVIGSDSKTDLAVIKIEAEGLTPAELGNSDQMELGEQVVTIGNPGNLTGTVTVGYVSGVHRKIRTDSNQYLMNCIQTDAAVNPGNSGGALVNMYGQVVGIVSSKYRLTGYEGLGFAIEMNEAKPIIEDIISQGYISGRLKIGISFIGIDDVTAAYNGIKKGLLIREIRDDCDISNTDLQVDDIITEINGREVYNTDTVLEALEGCKPGDKVKATVYRRSIISDDEGETFEIEFELQQDESLS